LAAPAVLGFLLARVSGSSGPNYAAFAQVVAASLVALAAGAWYAEAAREVGLSEPSS